MKFTGKIKENILSAVMVAAFLFLIGTPAHAAGQSLFTTQVPTELSQSDGATVKYELGTVFQSNTAGQISAIRFWKDVNETGTHTGHVWSAKGALLASAVFTNETASGWQQVSLNTPLAIAANTTYIVSVNTGKSYYVSTTSGLASKVTNGSLSTVVGNNGLYGTTGKFPTSSWHASNYFRDVVFVSSSSSTVPVTTSATAPAITTQPASISVNSGQTATFNVAATGTAPMTFQWKKNGAAIGGATASTYTTPAETVTDNSTQFTVALSNSMGTANSNAAVLTVNSTVTAPAITSQPASQTVVAGKTATFSVSVTGTAPMTYQWSKNGAAISGATSSTYTTPAETTSDNNATFTVAVSNSAGSATSSAATLTVSATTLVLNSSASSLSFGNVNVSSTGTKTVTLTNAGTGTITISGVTISGAGFNASGVSTGLMLTAGQTVTLTASFDPSAAGNVTGSVSVASNASNSPDAIALSGTGVAAVNHSVDLSWTPSTSTVTGYNTYSGSKTGGPYTKLTSTPAAGTSYTDSTVQSGQTYFYVVTSVDSAGTESTYSSEISTTIP